MAEACDDRAIAEPGRHAACGFEAGHAITFGAGTVIRRGNRHAPARRVLNAVLATSATVSATDSADAAETLGISIASRIGATARPIGTCAAFHSFASPRMLIRISAGI